MKKDFLVPLFSCISATLLLLTSLNTTAATPKNIIFMIGDGMGPSYTSAYRYYNDNPATPSVETTTFDELFVGMAQTRPNLKSGFITDSAAAASALATGHKVVSKALSVNSQAQPLKTLFEYAKEKNKYTGVVVTSPIYHATPAAFLVHHPLRYEYDLIADKLIQSPADVMFGGGTKHLTARHQSALKKQGYEIIYDYQQINNLTQPKVVGLFGEFGLPWAIDDPEPHRLSLMTKKALELLSQHNEGFVLLIEGSQIDWAGHANDSTAAMREMEDFEKAIQTVQEFIRRHPDTLMVVTADHSTGGFTIGSNQTPKKYSWEPRFLKNVQHSPQYIVKHLPEEKTAQKSYLEKQLNMSLNQQQWDVIQTAHQKKHLMSTLKHLIDEQSHTGWTTRGHTGEDVQVFAFGAGSETFVGHQDNTDIGKKLIDFVR